MEHISIIGFGRFGKTLYRLLREDFAITIFTRSEIPEGDRQNFTKETTVTKNLEEVYKNNTVLFAVPIPAFENVIKTHKKYFTDEHILIDVLSVKIHPKKVFEKYLKNSKTQALLTHPMFGPDSSKNGFISLPLIMDKFKASDKTYKFWKNFFENKKLTVIEMSAIEHDKLAASSQGLTHFLGRLLGEVHFKPSAIDSVGTQLLHKVKEQTCNDTWELFRGLQTYNPYTKAMRLKIGKAYDFLYNKLLPSRVNKKYLVFGIQGGKGSFNEQALLQYISDKKIKKFRIKYLFTTEKVLKNLHEGDIDFGIFAISNSTGGLVEESIKAMAKYTFSIVEDFVILIRHYLMKRKDISLDAIKTIMAHPQVFKQCEQTLADKFPHFSHLSGEGDNVDTAKAAEELSKSNIDKNIAILGPKILAKKYNFDIIAEDLQDKKDNFTRFLLTTRLYRK